MMIRQPKFIFFGLLISLFGPTAFAKTPADTIIAQTTLISNEAIGGAKNVLAEPGKKALYITSKDKIMYFFSTLNVVNPTKESYIGRLECIDKNGNVIISSEIQRTIYRKERIAEDEVAEFDLTLGLDPKPGTLVKGQATPLKDGENYYIRTYIEGKLINLAPFRYRIE